MKKPLLIITAAILCATLRASVPDLRQLFIGHPTGMEIWLGSFNYSYGVDYDGDDEFIRQGVLEWSRGNVRAVVDMQGRAEQVTHYYCRYRDRWIWDKNVLN